MKKILLVLIAFLGISSYCNAQFVTDTVKVAQEWIIETKDGNTFTGQIIEDNDEYILFQTEKFGQIRIIRREIVSMKPLRTEQLVDGEYWFENPHATRYYWAPNAYGLKQGEGYYQNTWVLLNQVSVGIRDNFSIGVGTIPIYLLGADVFPFWVTPKFTVPIKKDQFNIGGGAIFASAIGEEEYFGIAYGVSTWGTKDKNFTLGLGYGFSGNGWAQLPTITLSWMSRMSKKTYFISENYLISTPDMSIGLLSAGFRSVGKTLAIDYGAFLPVAANMDGFILLPWLGISVPFGNTATQK